jgi:Asp-tRNA(Asn)/Glu-tRNA(Gln) amidotransferase A subunit family amidase
MHDLTLAELSAALRRGATSSEELARHFLARIERLDPRSAPSKKRGPRMPHAVGARPGP